MQITNSSSSGRRDMWLCAAMPVALAFLVSHVPAAGPATTRAGEKDSFLNNPSFEDVTPNGAPAGWGLGGLAPEMTWSLDTEVKHSGKQSLKIVGKGVTRLWAGLTHPPLELDGPATYRFSGWLRGEDYATVSPKARGASHALWFHVKVAGTDQKLPAFSLGINKDGTYDWTFVENEFSVPCRASLEAGAWAAFNGTQWYDDIKIELVGKIGPSQTERGLTPSELAGRFPDAILAEDGSLAVLFAPPVKKITRRITPEDGAIEGGKRAKISLARNESEAVQLVLVPLTDETFTLELFTTEPHKQTGELLRSAIAVHPVGYVGYSDGKRLVSEPWPDLLLDDASVRVRPGELQPLWVEVRAAPDAPAGDYVATVTLTRKRKPIAVVPIDVTVYDFALPATPTLPTAMATHVRAGQRRLLEHRIGLTYTCLPMVGFTRFDNRIWYKQREFADVRPAVDSMLAEIESFGGRNFCIEIPRFPGTFPGGATSIGGYQKFTANYSESQRKYIVRYYRQYAEYLKGRGLFDLGIVYLYDEPEDSAFDFIHDCRELIRKADPDLRCMVDDVAQRPRISELKRRMDEWFARYVDPRRDGLREDGTQEGQTRLVW